MGYGGELLSHCPAKAFDLGRAFAVIVSGYSINIWGHALLNAGGPGGTYFQIDGVYSRPRYMNEEGYQRYLKEFGKKELRRYPLHLSNIPAAQLKLEELMSKRWAFGLVRHNCEAFVEEIIVAGGGRPIHEGYLFLPVDSRQQTAGASGSW